jgi:DNA topoisomerase-1
MRTENTKYSAVFLKEMKDFITNKWTDTYCGDFENLTNKDNGNPHEAIRVTKLQLSDLNVDLSNEFDENNDEKENHDKIDSKTKNTMLNSLYKLIWRNTVESCMNSATYETTKIHIDAPLENAVYVYTNNKPIHLGWRTVHHHKEEKENQSSQAALMLYFNSLKKDAIIKHNHINATVSFHNKHSHYTESSLIKKLEELKIGRPSTFSSLVDTIQMRGYVKKMDVEGEKHICKEYSLVDNKIIERTVEKVVGNEKNKLIIQPLGITTVEFLIQHFASLFSYDYTKKMEEQLDIIACPEETEENIEWYELCKQCSAEIDGSTKPITKQKYTIDDRHELVFERFGPVIKYLLPPENVVVVPEIKPETEDPEGKPKKKRVSKKKEVTVEEKWEYKSVKKGLKLDLEKLRRGEYSLEELLEPNNIYLGLWKGKEVRVKSGQYGNYIEYDGQRQNIKNVNKAIEEVKLGDVEMYLKAMTPVENEITSGDETTGVKIYQNLHNKSILRVLNKDFSIRSGKFGPYIYYKKENMSKPQFFSIRGFKEGFSVCDVNVLLEWIYMKYKLPRY